MNKYHPSEIVFSCLARSAKRPNFRQPSLAAGFLLCTNDRGIRYKVIGCLLVAPLPFSRAAAGALAVNECIREVKALINHCLHEKGQYRELLYQNVLTAHDDALRINLSL